MGLETATYINGLVATNPVGATDPKSQGDDHLRLLKATILATFAAITGAVSASHTELNLLTGATGLTGTGDTVRSASPTFTGTLVAAAATFSSTVTVPNSNFTYAKINDAAAVSVLGRSANSSGVLADIAAGANDRVLGRASNALSFMQLTAGMFPSTVVPDAALSANVPLLNASNTFTGGTQTVAAAGALAYIKSSNTSGGWLQWATSDTVRGYFGNGTLISGGSPGVGDIALRAASGGLYFSGNNGTTAHFALSSAGLVTTPNADPSEVGKAGLPINEQSDNYTCVLADANKAVGQTGTSKTITIPAHASVAFPDGTTLTFYGRVASTTTIAITTDTMYLRGTGFATTGSRTLAAGGIATAVKIAGTWWIGGDVS